MVKTGVDIIISNLSQLRAELLEQKVKLLTDSLPTRARNTVQIYLNDEVNLHTIHKNDLLRNKSKLKNIKNVGSKTNEELEAYFSNIKREIYRIQHLSHTEAEYEYNYGKMSELSKKHKIPIKVMLTGSVFLVAEHIIQDKVYKNKNTDLIDGLLKIRTGSNSYTLTQLGKKHGITRERVRQVRNKSLETIEQEFSMLNEIGKFSLDRYGLSSEKKVICSDHSVFSEIKAKNSLKMTNNMVFFIASKCLASDYTFLGSVEGLLFSRQSTPKTQHIWKQSYLINNEYDSLIVSNFIKYLHKKNKEKIEEDTEVKLIDFVVNNFNNPVIYTEPEFTELVLEVVKKEFGNNFVKAGKIILPRNTRKLNYEYVYEALEKLDRPSTVEEIADTVNELNPTFGATKTIVKSALLRANGFAPMGRNSVFALTKWESEKSDFKVGTIREIVEEFLMEKESPQHISVIAKHVKKYRSSAKGTNIQASLNLDNKGIFTSYEKAHFGLASKEYSKEYVLLSESSSSGRKSWEYRFAELSNFIKIHGRLPRFTSKSMAEVRLYRWVRAQHRSIRLEKLSDKQEEMFKKLMKAFD